VLVPRTTLATLALLAATAVWGATFVTVKGALAAADPMTFLALRFAVGALAAGLIGWRSWATDWKGLLRPGFTLGLLLFGGYALQTVGLLTSSPSRSAFITGLTVIGVPFASWVLSGHRPPVRAFVAPIVALIGLQRLTGVSFSDPIPFGDALTLGCAAFYAFHIVATTRLGAGRPAMVLTALQLAAVSGLSGLCLPVVDRHFESTASFALAVLFTGIVASAVAIGVQVWAQQHLSPVRAAVIYSLEPVFALAWSAVLGLGLPTASEVVGGGFILLAVLVSEVPWRESAPDCT
jgi:drug/metabolite transporter (DMT)-like permease